MSQSAAVLLPTAACMHQLDSSANALWLPETPAHAALLQVLSWWLTPLPRPAASTAPVTDTSALPCACQGPDQINIKDITTPPFDITGGYQLEYTHGENPKNLPTVNLTRSGAQPQQCCCCCPAV